MNCCWILINWPVRFHPHWGSWHNSITWLCIAIHDWMVPFHRHCVPYPMSEYASIVPIWSAPVAVTVGTYPMLPSIMPCVPLRKDAWPQVRYYVAFYWVLLKSLLLFVPIHLIRELLFIYLFLYKNILFCRFLKHIYIYISVDSHYITLTSRNR